MNLDEALHTFIAESRELLDDMEHALLNIATVAEPGESINAIFRAAHTIKGSAGLFSLDAVVGFTHGVESVLDEVRAGRLALDDGLIELLLASGDHMRALIDAVDSHADTAAAPLTETGTQLSERLHHHLARARGEQPAGPAPARPAAASAAAPAQGAEAAPAAPDAAQAGHWHLSLRFGPNVLTNGMDPLSFIRYLATLGTVVCVETITEAVPPLESLQPEACCLGFELAFQSDADKATIENVFEFVLDDCHLRILPPHSRVADYLALIGEQPDSPPRLGEMLVRCGSLTERELASALEAQAQVRDSAMPAPKLGSVLVERGAVTPAVVDAALAKQKQVKEQKAGESQLIRVEAEKLDRLIDLVGELIIASASANLAARRTHSLELQECNATLASLVEEVRDSALQLRMVKIGPTFNRFQRVVHDVSRELGKEIELIVRGEDTELDKTLIEKIGDPLTHLVRNALDHGIADPEYRIARGKPGRGTLTLNAFHDSGSIVIEVSDDGRGLNRDKILAKAIERGLVDANKPLTEREIFNLIFEPGFSTADQVTNLSGRGVGMDVVKRNITALRGTVDVSSEQGMGTTVSVRLPLTLAIIDGFQVGVGRSTFVIPLDMVDECVAYSAEPGHDYTDLRGQVLPFIRLRELFGIGGSAGPRENIVVVKCAGQKFGLVVDTLLGEAQTVIKPLAKLFGQVRGIGGSSILGSGEVALILDVPALLQLTQTARPAHRAAVAA